MAIAAPSLAQPNLLDGLKREAVITFQRTTMGGQVTVLFYADGRLKVHSYHADTVTEGRCDTAKVLRIARLAKAINFTQSYTHHGSIVPDAWEHIGYEVNAPANIAPDSAGAVGLTSSDIIDEIRKLCRFPGQKPKK